MNKTIFMALILLASTLYVAAKPTANAKVDERVEFITAVYNQVGLQKNKTNHYAPYAEELKNYLKPYENKLMIPMVKARLDNVIDYEILLEQALASTIKDGKIQFSIPEEIKSDPQMWSYVNLFKTLEELYVEASFEKFFESHKSIYKEAEELYDREVVSQLNFDVLEKLYNIKSDNMPSVYITMLEGINVDRYIKSGGSVLLGGFAIKATPDGKGELSRWPTYSTYTLVKGLLDVALSEQLEQESSKCAKQTFNYYNSAPLLFKEAGYVPEHIYTSQILNLATLLYVEEVEKLDIADIIKGDKRQGFIWENELWNSLDNFKNQRDKFPYFLSYIPWLTREYNQLLIQ